VVIKTREEEALISDLAETFDNLRKFKMKLNSENLSQRLDFSPTGKGVNIGVIAKFDY
jgi:hypothetical protein